MASDGDGEHAHCLPMNVDGGMSQHAAPQDAAGPAVLPSVTCSDCMLVGDYSRDGRDGKIKLKDAQYHSPVAIIAANTSQSYIHRTALRNGVRCRFATPGVSPPLNLLHCVHLK